MTRTVRAWLAAAVVVLLAGLLSSCAVQTPLGTIHVYANSPSRPGALVVTPDGSVWFANQGNPTIGRRSPDGTVTTFFAPGLRSAVALTVGPDGDVWFATGGGDDRVGRITPDGEISTWRSGLYPAAWSNNLVNDITAGPDGNIWYVGQTGAQPGAIAKRTPAGVVTVYSGFGSAKSVAAGSDGNLWYTTGATATAPDQIVRITPQGVSTPFTTAGLIPGDITAGPDGNLWFINANKRIGRITTSGAITLFDQTAIAYPTQITAGPDGNLWFIGGDRAIGRITTAGVATRFTDPAMVAPGGIATASDGLWFTNATGSSSGTIGHISTTGTITLPGPGANVPIAITKDTDGTVWFANWHYEADGSTGIGRIAPDGTTQVFHDKGLYLPHRIAPGADGSAWVTNPTLDTIGRVSRTGTFTYFSDPKIHNPLGITRGSDGSSWFTNYGSGTIGRITPQGAVTAFPAGGILKPVDITTASDGGMWFDDEGPSVKVGRIDTSGAVRTFNLPYPPTAISAIGPDLWFTASNQNLIGKITPGGVVSTYTDPLIVFPASLAGDAAGNVYFGNGFPVNGGNGFYTGMSIGRRTPAGLVTLYPSDVIPNGMVGGPGDIYFTTGVANSVVRFGTKP